MNKRLPSVLLLAALAASPGCALLKHRKAPYPTGVIFPVVEDGSVPFDGRPNGGLRATAGRAYLTSRAGEVRSLDIAGKAVVWTYKTGAPILEPPFLGAENIYVRDRDDVLYAMGPSGALLWKRPVGEKVLTPVVEGGGRIHFGTEAGRLWSVRLDGTDARSFEAGSPVTAGPFVDGGRAVFASADGKLHVLDPAGRLLWTAKAPGPVSGPIGGGKDLVFFGTDDRTFYGWRIGAKKPRWKVRLGGHPAATPVVDGGRLFLLGTNSVLYCLKPSGGDLLWWANVPSRTAFDLEVAGGKVLVASLSPLLLAFDAATGRKAGEFEAGGDLASNAVWTEPYLAALRYDAVKDAGALVRLAKEVGVKLTTTKASPRTAGEEIPFTAEAVGFFEPRFEFYVKAASGREVLQKSSEKAAWSWFAETEGTYTLGVVATDAKSSREAEIPFVIEKKPEPKAADAPAKAEKGKKAKTTKTETPAKKKKEKTT